MGYCIDMAGVFCHMIRELQNPMAGICYLKSLECQAEAQKASELEI